MPNLTTELPKRTGNPEKDYEILYNWAISLTDELKALLCNLDSGNVTEAASVEARNIDCSKAKIKDAQIKSLTADKLTAGTIDAEEIEVINLNADNIVTGTLNAGLITIEGETDNGRAKITGDAMEMYDGNGNLRVAMGATSEGKYIFTVQNADATQGIYMGEEGDIFITGAQYGTKLVLRDTDDRTVGHNEALTITVNEGTVSIDAKNGRYIDLTGGRLTFNGRNVSTE